MKKRPSVYENVNNLLLKAGWEKPEEVSAEIRLKEVMRVLLNMPMVGPKGYPNAQS